MGLEDVLSGPKKGNLVVVDESLLKSSLAGVLEEILGPHIEHPL